jgi:hypothetical protein
VRHVLTRRVAVACAAGVLAMTALAATAIPPVATASAGTTYAFDVQIGYGFQYTNYGVYHSTYYYIDGNEALTHYSGVWMVNGNGWRSSAAAWCDTGGYTAIESWSGSYPTGYPTVHNHGPSGSGWYYGSTYWHT